jgi:hypothetical protein
MAVSVKTKEDLYKRAGGKCECQMKACDHVGRCNTKLGNNWHAHHKTSVDDGGSDDLGNLLAMCPECHKATRTYGR